MDAYGVLVIILSITLAIFLVIGIVLLVYLIKLVNQVRVITAKADAIVDDVEAVSDFFRKTAAPVAIGNLVSNIVSMVNDRRKRK
jgi:hypothetical protein